MLKTPELVAGRGPKVVFAWPKVGELKRVGSLLSWSCGCWVQITAGRGQGSGGGGGVGGGLGRPGAQRSAPNRSPASGGSARERERDLSWAGDEAGAQRARACGEGAKQAEGGPERFPR